MANKFQVKLHAKLLLLQCSKAETDHITAEIGITLQDKIQILPAITTCNSNCNKLQLSLIIGVPDVPIVLPLQ